MHAQAPRVSVVLPVRNGGRTLGDALACLLEQTFTDFEVVVVDDGSDDETPVILAALDDPRVRTIRNVGSGIVDALRLGVASTRGDYIARMDADDRCSRSRLAAQVEVLDAHPGVGVVACSFGSITEDERPAHTTVVLPDDALLRRALWVGNPFAHGSVVMRRSAYEAAGGYRAEFPAAEDYDLWWRMADVGALAAVPGVHYEWRVSPTGISRVHGATQIASTARILDARWATGSPVLEDRRLLAARVRRLRSVDSGELDLVQRCDELQIAIIEALVRRGHPRAAVAQLWELLRSRPGACGSVAVYLLTARRVTRVRRVVAAIRRRAAHTMTVRISSPASMARNASFTSSRAMRRVTIDARSRRPVSASATRRGKSRRI